MPHSNSILESIQESIGLEIGMIWFQYTAVGKVSGMFGIAVLSYQTDSSLKSSETGASAEPSRNLA